MERETLLEKELREVRKILCVCEELRPRGGWPRTRGQVECSPEDEEAMETWAADTGAKTYAKYRYIHVAGCPSAAKAIDLVRKNARPIAERLVALQAQVNRLRAKAADGKYRPTWVGIHPYWYRYGHGYRNDLTIEDIKDVLTTLAEGLGAKVITGRGWERQDDDFGRADPIMEKVTYGKGKEKRVEEEVAGLGESGHDDWDPVAVFPTRERAETFLQVGRALHPLMEKSYQTGKRQGAALLERLASGDITVREMEERVDDDRDVD